ncbi:MAG TPA: GNAT family N-acetyltransferase [Gemmatimonadales bacterium]|nr:GNAT family N-acetyltransferase [Gemmatimonadales bacterium]
MNPQPPRIERLAPPVSDADLRGLAELLVDAVSSGAAVSFLPPLTVEKAEAWWREATATANPKTIFLVARDAVGIVGTVQLHPSWAPNQPHRGDIAKLVVHRRSRRTGVGFQLMQAIEREARQAGLTLLTLDTKQGDGAEQLYRRGGWVEVGVIPKYALNPDGTMHATVVFYKSLDGSK